MNLLCWNLLIQQNKRKPEEMGKLFTITEGLENLGALKTGGQGSVYKGKRLGEIFTAIKLLPTPIHSETEDDKNYRDFKNEVEKLKKVNEKPNPNVVKILNSGITDTGNFPFIEMEFIEGPDLEELLKQPHDSVFTLKEITKVAEHLSNALSHCHTIGINHGDIKSNNVKFNVHTGNYVLLDFGLAVMSDEQRRTSLRHAGAIEFMAPEQNEGRMLFQTDVYSFGVVLFELIAGVVPFPLRDKGATARNSVMVAHMEVPPPNVLELRKQNIPKSWTTEKKEHEMQVPGWLVSMIYKCLEKKPEQRFANGQQLHEYIILNSTLATKKEEVNAEFTDTLQNENQKLLVEKEQLQKSLTKHQQEMGQLKQAVINKENELDEFRQRAYTTANRLPRQGVSTSVFYALLLITALLTAFAAYSLLSGKWYRTENRSKEGLSKLPTDTQSYNARVPAGENKTNNPDKEIAKPYRSAPDTLQTTQSQQQTDPMNFDTTRSGDPFVGGEILGKYKVKSKAFFYNAPDENTRRDAFIVHWNNAVLNALDEKDGFIYVVFINEEGKTSKGWLSKRDLVFVP